MTIEPSPLDNAVWQALTTRHARFAESAGTARRYHPDVSVFAAVQEPDDQSWRDLASLLRPGEHAVLFRTEMPEPPAGWTRLGGGIGHQMVLRALAPVDVPDARPLGPDDVGEMLALVELTRPGPFGVRTVELGGYLGVFDDGALVAMAGERLRLPGFCEISAVCTRPDHRGRGLAAGLTALVARAIQARGEQPFLHHAADNDPARRVYESLGFEFRSVPGRVAQLGVEVGRWQAGDDLLDHFLRRRGGLDHIAETGHAQPGRLRHHR
jgi:ribosomal protein S18 acetylase RimI-like enzyme